MNCPKCGKRMKNGTRFCPYCGAERGPEEEGRIEQGSIGWRRYLLLAFTVVGFLCAVVNAIFGIILGVVATEMGFLAGNTLEKCGFYGLMMFFMVSSALDPLAQVDLTSLLAGLWPLFFYMIGGCAATMIGGMLAGKLLKVDWRLACALSCGCMLGFPSTLIAAEDVVDSFGFPEETRAQVRETLGVKMTIAGFATVSTSSIVIASLIAQLLGQ